jgi:hypothetical protein
LRTSQEGQVTDRFTKAIAQLGDERLELRLGGIYALERIARDSQKDYWPIMEILTAYVRERRPRKDIIWSAKGVKRIEPAGPTLSRRPPKPPIDIQAVLTVLGRRTTIEGPPLDLAEADLRATDLAQAHLEKARLVEVHLHGANLNGADLRGAELREALFWWTRLIGTDLRGAQLDRADFQGALLWRTDLRGADFGRANLGGADLEGADLRGVDLRGVENLTEAQVASARTDENTKLPDYLTSPPTTETKGP